MPTRNATIEEAADKIHSAAIHLLRYAAKEDAAAGIGPARLSALSVVVFAGPLTLGELAAAEGVRAPTTSRIVSGLEDAGLVRRVADAADRRSVRVAATTKGTRLLQRARRRRIDALVRLLGGLDAGDVAVVAAAAELVEAALRTAASGRGA